MQLLYCKGAGNMSQLMASGTVSSAGEETDQEFHTIEIGEQQGHKDSSADRRTEREKGSNADRQTDRQTGI